MNNYLNEKYNNLNLIAEDNYKSYVSADPFPHIVFDNFFNEKFLNEVLNEFPNELDKIGGKYSTNQEKKSFSNSPEKLSPKINDFLNFTNSHKFIDFINKLSVMERPLIPDPYLFGGGVHELKDGGFLNIHCDFNKHPKMNLDRRINVLIYLNHDWKDEYGGALELWDKDMKSCVQKIKPIFNRMVIFNTTNFSYHGNPDTVKLSDKSKSRKSIALYYYSNGRPDNEVSTIYHKLLIGPDDTPYQKGFYLFEGQFPDNYPFKPMTMRTITQGSDDGNKTGIRKHPNLYVCGKCCFSFLGTWAGPPWTACNNAKSVAISMRSVMTKFPLENEPGYEREERNKVNGIFKNQDLHDEYAGLISWFNIKHAVCGVIHKIDEVPYKYFKTEILEEFKKNYQYFI